MEIKIQYVWQNGNSFIKEQFTLDQIEAGEQYETFTDAPLHRNYRCVAKRQFIGITDKNGIEIYEGDWCRAMFRTREGIQVIQGHIMMDEHMWCIDCTGCVGEEIFSINRPHDFEIIGNIYENPNLLNNGN